jgi:hypothetical protein
MKVKTKMKSNNQGGNFARLATWEIPREYVPDLVGRTSGKIVSTSVLE